MAPEVANVDIGDYKYGFHDEEAPVIKIDRGLDEDVIRQISAHKGEPEWMLDFRLEAYEIFKSKPMPSWGADLSGIDFENIFYYLKPAEHNARSWDDVPETIKNTFERLGIPEAERKFLAGVGAQYESEVIYHSLKKELEDLGVLFLDTDQALLEHEELFREYWATVIPAADNKFAALNSAVWSGGSFIYVPPGVRVEQPLQAYFRINAENMGQFERTLIIVDEGAYVHYVEGCTAPTYSSDSLHSAVVEIIVKKGGRCRYTTIQNWSDNVYNLVTKRAIAEEDATMEWVDGNLGCLSSDSRVFLEKNAPRSIAELRKGDGVRAFNLSTLRPEVHKVLGLKESGTQAVYGIETANYCRLKATANHPFLVLESATPKGSPTLTWKMLYDIHPGDRVGIMYGTPDDGAPRDLTSYAYRGPARGRPRADLRLPVETDDDLLWLLGAYLGDGYTERAKSRSGARLYFAVPPQDSARHRLEQTIERLFGVRGKQKGPVAFVVGSTVLADFFDWLEISGNAHTKRIPDWIWSLPASQRLSLIEGYLDADGHVRVRNTNTKSKEQYGQLVFTSANRDLLEDLKLLALGCGLTSGKISSSSKRRELRAGKGFKTYVSYTLSFNLHKNLPIIRSHTPPNIRLEFTPVREVTPLPAEPTYDIEVEGAHNFIANGLLVHNSKITMKYPAVILKGERAHGEILSIAFAGEGQHQDAGGKITHAAPNTTSVITSKSISKDGGRSSYRGLLRVDRNAEHSKSMVVCDALIIDPDSRTDTYPYINISADEVDIGHEATVSKLGEEQIYYLMSRGLSESEASGLIVAGFIEPIVKELPLEYAVEMNRLIQLQMEGSVG